MDAIFSSRVSYCSYLFPNLDILQQVLKTFRLLHLAMKTSIVVGIILTALALTLLYHTTVISKLLRSVTIDRSVSKNIHDSFHESVDKELDKEEETNQADSQFEEYSFHDACPCRRTAPPLSHLEQHFDAAKLELALSSSGLWKPVNGSYVGHSTCNRYSMLWKISCSSK